MRRALGGLRRYIATIETSKFKPFMFLAGAVLPDHKVYAVATDDAFILGTLSSRPHALWARVAGGTLEDRPTWTNTTCFLPFPFPDATAEQKARIRDWGEQLDAHRKKQQAEYPELTITGMYNVLEKLRSGEELTAKERVIHEQGLVSILKQIHDEVDTAVFDAYGWPHDLTDEQILERLVALNAERAEEERNGLIRWLRPEFQNPSGAKAASQAALAGVESASAGESEEGDDEEAKPAAKGAPWPKKLPERIAAVRDLVGGSRGAWSVEQTAAAFAGAKRAEVEVVLESLAALGLVVGYEVNGEARYRAAARVAA